MKINETDLLMDLYDVGKMEDVIKKKENLSTLKLDKLTFPIFKYERKTTKKSWQVV
jgi:hypothetical protein